MAPLPILLLIGFAPQARCCAGGGAAQAPPAIQRLTRDGLDKQRPMWSPDGHLLTFARHEPDGAAIWQYVLVPGKPETLRRLTDRKTPDYNAAFSPDGTRLLLCTITQSGTQGNLDIGLINADGSDLKTVAGDAKGKLAHQDWPSWSPDGARFAYSSTHEGNQEIYRADADGKNVVRLTQSPGHDAHPCWTPDGSRIVFATDRWGGLELASVADDGTDAVRITDSPGFDDYPAVSPDGSRVAWVSNRDGNYEIYVAAIDGSGPRNVSNHPGRDTHPTWTPDGRGITFLSERDGGTDVYILILDPEPAGGKGGAR
jgi:TolB protein